MGLLPRLLAVIRHRRRDADLDEEVRAHLELLAADYERGGLSPADARLAARRAFGSVEPMKERHRDGRSLRWLEDLVGDTRLALRGLRRAPVFTLSAGLTLALGMAAMGAMLTILNAFMFRPLPVDAPEALISISAIDSHSTLPHGVSFLDLRDYVARSGVLADAMGYTPRAVALNAGDTSGAERITINLVTDNYFSVLGGIRPAAGRLLRAGEGRARGDAPVVVLAHGYWQRRFAGDPAVVGRAVRVNGVPLTVIGVTPPEFRGADPLFRAEAFVPIWIWDALMQNSGDASLLNERNSHALFAIGRLAPSVSLERARAALLTTAATLAQDHHSTNAGVSLRVVPEAHARPNPSIGPFFRVAAGAMTALAALLLVIMAANVANLLMARAAGRRREVALRVALGGGRARLVRQLLTESVVLSLLGAIAAVPVVLVAVQAVRDFVSRAITTVVVDPDLTLDARVLGATFAVAAVAGIVAGLWPALIASRTPSGALHAGGERMSASGGRLRGALVVAQVALSLALLVSGGLFARSLARARTVDVGFEAQGLVVATAGPGMRGYEAARRLEYYKAVRDRLDALPGTDNAAWISMLPLGIINEFSSLVPDTRPADPQWKPPTSYEADVSPEYFATVGLRIVDGRGFTAGDAAESPQVSVINETLARQFWPDRSAIGRRLIVDDVPTEVVGVVRNGKYMNVAETPQGMVFRPLAQVPTRFATVVVRTRTLEPSAIARAMRDHDADVAVYDVRTMADHLDSGAFLLFRLGALVTGIFGIMGLLLAAVGLYGVIAYQVTQRTSEIGLRMALGARVTDVLRDVVGRGTRLALTGVAAGVMIAAALAALLRPLLVGTSPFDPLTYGLVTLFLAAVCIVASLVPAWRAAMVNPVAALRGE